MTSPNTNDDAVGQRFRATIAAIAVIAVALVFLQTDATLQDMIAVGQDYTAAMSVIAAFFLVLRATLDLIVTMFRARRGKTNGEPAYKLVLARINGRDILVALFALSLTTTSYTVYKSTFIGSGGYGWDAAFIAWDRAMFLGNDPWTLTHRLFPSAQATHILDHLYHPAFLPMVIGFLLCVALQDRAALRYTYMTCYLAGFVLIGMVMAAALHSAGPVYDGKLFGDGSTFAPLIDRLATQSAEIKVNAVRFQRYLLELHTSNNVGFGGGISGMPSVHIMLTAIWVFAAWHIHKAIGTLMTVYGVIIWIGSVHLGWHYFADGLVSIIVIGGVWYTTGRGYGLFNQAQLIRATT